MRRYCALSTALAGALLGHASLATADGQVMVPASPPPVIAAVDVNTIPRGSFPRVLNEADAPTLPAKEDPAAGLKIEKLKRPLGKLKRPLARLRSKRVMGNMAELAPSDPEIGALYIPWQDGADFQGESVAFACYQNGPLSPLRWETLTVDPDGSARLDIKDLWLDTARCTATRPPSAPEASALRFPSSMGACDNSN